MTQVTGRSRTVHMTGPPCLQGTLPQRWSRWGWVGWGEWTANQFSPIRDHKQKTVFNWRKKKVLWITVSLQHYWGHWYSVTPLHCPETYLFNLENSLNIMPKISPTTPQNAHRRESLSCLGSFFLPFSFNFFLSFSSLAGFYTAINRIFPILPHQMEFRMAHVT